MELYSAESIAALLAAFVNRPASMSGKTGTPFTRGGEQRSQRSRPQSLSVEQAPRVAENRPRPVSSTGKSRRVVSENASPPMEEEEELPDPIEDKKVIDKALQDRKMCFFQARGLNCPHQMKKRGCRYSHDSIIVPLGYYADSTVSALEAADEAAADMARVYGVEPTASSDTSSTIVDTPHHNSS